VREPANGIARRALPWHDPRATAHEILGVDTQASSETIRRAYVELIRVWHPDRFAGAPDLLREAELATKRIIDAYDELSQPNRARSAVRRLRRATRRLAFRELEDTATGYQAWPGQTPAERVMVVLATLVVCVLTSLALVLGLGMWYEMLR
jgi:hypothetical protein